MVSPPCPWNQPYLADGTTDLWIPLSFLMTARPRKFGKNRPLRFWSDERDLLRCEYPRALLLIARCRRKKGSFSVRHFLAGLPLFHWLPLSSPSSMDLASFLKISPPNSLCLFHVQVWLLFWKEKAEKFEENFNLFVVRFISVFQANQPSRIQTYLCKAIRL